MLKSLFELLLLPLLTEHETKNKNEINEMINNLTKGILNRDFKRLFFMNYLKINTKNQTVFILIGNFYDILIRQIFVFQHTFKIISYLHVIFSEEKYILIKFFMFY